MPATESAQVLLWAPDPQLDRTVRAALESADMAIISRGDSDVGSADYDLAILCSDRQDGETEEACRRLRRQFADTFVPIVLLTGVSIPDLDVLENVDVLLRLPMDGRELSARIRALVRLKKAHEQVMESHTSPADLHRRILQAHTQLREYSDLAGRIQSTLLPRELPHVPPWRFAVHHRPRERAGGDLHDVFRLDEDHVGFYLADVLAHGIEGSLLSVFLRRAFTPKEIQGNSYRLLPPAEALARLNREFVGLELPEKPFAMMLYGLLGKGDHQFTFASAGNYSPLYLPRGGNPVYLPSPGGFLGVNDTPLVNQAHVLKPGAKLLFASDGIDALDANTPTTAKEALLDAAKQGSQLPIDQLVAQVSRALLEKCAEPDDFTLLGIEVESSRGE
jgi:phosphoserine phosphatase RsbU/P